MSKKLFRITEATKKEKFRCFVKYTKEYER